MKTLALLALLTLTAVTAGIAGEPRIIAAPSRAATSASPPSQARALQLIGEGRAPVTAPALEHFHGHHHGHGHHHDDHQFDYYPYISDYELRRNKPLYCVNCYNH